MTEPTVLSKSLSCLEPGQRLGYFHESERFSATILKVKKDAVTLELYGQPVYVVEKDCAELTNSQLRERFEVPHLDASRAPWTVIAGAVLDKTKLSRLQLDYQLDWLRSKVESTKKQREESGRGDMDPLIAFYQPSVVQYGERSHKDPVGYSKLSTQEAVKDLKKALEERYDGVDFHVTHKKDKAFVQWSDGPVFVSRTTDLFLRDALSPEKALVSIAPKREISDSLIQSAIAFIQCIFRVKHTEHANKLVDANLYRSGVLKSVFIPTNTFDLSYADLVRLTLLRWDDYAQKFVGEGITRYMKEENTALFGQFENSLALPNQIMSEIRQMAFAKEMQSELQTVVDNRMHSDVNH